MTVMETFPLTSAQGALRGANRNRTGAAFRLAATITASLTLLLAHPAQAKCRTHKCWARVSELRHAHYWIHRFHFSPVYWQRWARATSRCESSMNPHINTGNGFYGGFQYTLPTARIAGFHRRPDLTTWYEQAVRSIRFARRYGTGAWPVCGR